MISKTMRAILHTLSYGNIEVESSRRLVDIKKLDAMNIFLKKMDIQIFNGDYEIPLRIYFPTEEAMTNGVEKGHTFPVLCLPHEMPQYISYFFSSHFTVLVRYFPFPQSCLSL